MSETPQGPPVHVDAQGVSYVKPSELAASPAFRSALNASHALTAHTPRADEPRTLAGEIHVLYTNHRGETRERRLLPRGLWFGATEWHPDPQWLLSAEDRETGERRDFALRDMLRSPKGEPRTPVRVDGNGVSHVAVSDLVQSPAFRAALAAGEPRTLERDEPAIRSAARVVAEYGAFTSDGQPTAALATLRSRIEDAMDATPERCESGCAASVVTHDVEGVPLCHRCALVLAAEAAALAPQGDDARERLAAELCWIDGINNLYVVSDPRGVMDFWRGASEEVRREWRHAADRILALLSLPLEESR